MLSFLSFCLMWTFLELCGCLISVLTELLGDCYTAILYSYEFYGFLCTVDPRSPRLP